MRADVATDTDSSSAVSTQCAGVQIVVVVVELNHGDLPIRTNDVVAG